MFEKTNKRFSYDFVIPAKAGIQLKTPGFRVKPGMTKNVRSQKSLSLLFKEQ
jgi:hypothetical protein